MKNSTFSLFGFWRPQSISIVIKTIGFWACFWMLFIWLQHAQLPDLGSAAAPVAASIIIVAVLLVITGLLRMDSGSYRDIGLRLTPRAPRQFVAGFGFGVAVATTMMAMLLVFTPLEIQLSTDSDTYAVLSVSFLILFTLALMEEIAFRSYPLFKLREALGIRPAVYITSVAFAFYHGFSLDNLLGPGVWGLFFAWMAISTNSIALPTGFHLGLNWLQALLGMKPQYSGSIWELSVDPGSGVSSVETLGLLMHVTLLVIGVLVVENLITRQRRKTRRDYS